MRTVKLMLFVLLVIVAYSSTGAETFRFTASADNRIHEEGNGPRWEWVLDEMTRLVGDEGVFHIMPGDFDYPGMTDASLKARFGSDVIWYPVVGNHELDFESKLDDFQWVVDAYPGLPYIVNSGPAGCKTTTYSFDYGNAHFVALNEYYDGSSDKGTNGDIVKELYDWLAADLAANTKPAVFVIGHEPAYPQERHVGDSLDGYPTNRDKFWKLLNDEKVIAYICGHTHIYSAIRQAQTGQYQCDAFTWQVDCGNAGNPKKDEQTFMDVVVTDTDVTFGAWRGTESKPFTLAASWTADISSAAAGSPAPSQPHTKNFESSYTLGQPIGAHPDWYDGDDDDDDGPIVTSGIGVGGSVGLAPADNIFTWTASAFTWSKAGKVVIGMDFQTDGNAHFDDDRIGWTTSNTSTNSSKILGVRMDQSGGGCNIEGYWDGANAEDKRPGIVDLPALSPNAWYRLRAEFAGLTDTSAKINVKLWSLDAAGKTVALIAAGSISDTGTLGDDAPHSKYFNAKTIWPAYKNNTDAAASADNAYFEIVPMPAHTNSKLLY